MIPYIIIVKVRNFHQPTAVSAQQGKNLQGGGAQLNRVKCFKT